MEPTSKPRSECEECLLIAGSGHFHADEALAVYLLRLLPNYASSSLVRTRDPAVLSTCHTVVDVGGEYDASANRYDHHQRTFADTFPEHQTKLSSAGLVYLHFGRAIIAQQTSTPQDHPNVSLLHKKLYDDFIEAIDANDNGISVYDSKETANLTKKFKDHGINLSSLVSDMNYAAADPLQPADASATLEQSTDPQALEDARFLDASKLMGTAFVRKLVKASESWLPARSSVLEAYQDRFSVDPSGLIMIVPPGIPWKDHLYTLEAEEPSAAAPKTVYVLYPESELEDSKWRVQAVAVSLDSFESRKALKEQWRGVRDEDLSSLSGIDGCVFVHASGFIGGNKTKRGALQMAKQSLMA